MEALEPDIVLPGRSSSPTPAIATPNENGGTGPAVCALCLSAPGKYTCPRCNAPYCSLACYKGARHSACSELFYRDSVLQALRDDETGGGGRKQMEEMLLKLREEERLSAVDEEESGLWNSLSRQEKEHFNQLIKSGHIASLLPQWTPWWDTHQMAPSQGNKIMELPESDPVQRAPLPTCGQDNGTKQTCPSGSNAPLPKSSQKKINHAATTVPAEGAQKMAPHMANEGQDLSKKTDLKEGVSVKHGCHKTDALDKSSVDKDDGLKVDETLLDDKSIPSEVPPLLGSIPPLSSLTRNPSPLVRFTLVNVIFSYSFSLLRHNGDLSDNDIMLDFIGTLLSVSGALSTTIVYNSTAHALKSTVRAACDPSLGGDEGVAVLAMEATAKILKGDGGKRYSLAALSHLYSLLGKIRKLVSEEKDLRKEAFNAKKKCLFLAAWVNENEEHLAVLSAEVMMEYKLYLKDLNEMAEISKGLQRVWGGKRPPAKKKLVEEVD